VFTQCARLALTSLKGSFYAETDVKYIYIRVILLILRI